MKYSESGFRTLYHTFAVFDMCDFFKPAINGYPGAAEADGVLVYGYIDNECGMTLELLCAVKCAEDGAMFFAHGDETKRTIIRIEGLENAEYKCIGQDSKLADIYARRIRLINEGYAVNDAVETTRRFDFLDEFRHKTYPDDVQVHLIKEGLTPEVCWVRISDMDEYNLCGKLLNEPYQEFGYHRGDTLSFGIYDHMLVSY